MGVPTYGPDGLQSYWLPAATTDARATLGVGTIIDTIPIAPSPLSAPIFPYYG